MEYRAVLFKRRSSYALKAASPVSDEELVKRVTEVIRESPSAYNAQNTRLVVALGDAHKKVWSITHDTLEKIVPPEKFPRTEAKLAGFAEGYGTLLVFKDALAIETLKKEHPAYVANADEWASQDFGIVAIHLWDTLVDLGFAVSMQHYNPLIDKDIAKTFHLPATWRLGCEMVFGMETAAPDPKDYLPIEGRVLVKRESE